MKRRGLESGDTIKYFVAICLGVLIFANFAVGGIEAYFDNVAGTSTTKTTSTYTTVVTNTTSTRTTTITNTWLPLGGNAPDWFLWLLLIAVIGVPVGLLMKYLDVV